MQEKRWIEVEKQKKLEEEMIERKRREEEEEANRPNPLAELNPGKITVPISVATEQGRLQRRLDYFVGLCLILFYCRPRPNLE